MAKIPPNLNLKLTKEKALKIQAEQVRYYANYCNNLAAEVAAITTADALEAGKEYTLEIINKHIPRGHNIEKLAAELNKKHQKPDGLAVYIY